jgi:hypothetical protein
VGAVALIDSIGGRAAIGLNDPSGTSTGWTLLLANRVVSAPVLVDERGAVRFSVVAPDAPPFIKNQYEASAWQDNLGVDAGFIVVSFEGLDTSKKYNLTFFGARGNQNSSQTWSMVRGTGGNSADTFTYDSTDPSVVVSYTHITPVSTDNVIRVKLKPDGKSGAINFAMIEEVPEQPAMIEEVFEQTETIGLLLSKADAPLWIRSAFLSNDSGSVVLPKSSSTSTWATVFGRVRG